MSIVHIYDFATTPSGEEPAISYTLRREAASAACPHYEISEADRKQLNHEVMDKLLAFGDVQLEGKSIRQWLAFEQTSMWYYHKFRLYFDTRNLYYDWAAIRELADQYEQLVLHTRRRVWEQFDLLPTNVKIVYEAGTSGKQRWGMLIQFGFLLMWRFLLSLTQWRHLRKVKHLLINRPANEVPMTMPESLEIRQENYYYGYILPQLPPDFLVLEEIDHPKPKGDQTYRISRRMWRPRSDVQQLGTDAILLRGLSRKKVRKKAQTIAQEISSVYAKLESLLTDPFDQLVWWQIRQLHTTSRFFAYKYAAYEHFFSSFAFKAMLIVDEGSPPIRLMWDAARARGVKVIGLQHGSIHSLHMAYRYTPADQAEFDPIPDQTFIWGDYWADVLAKEGHYPANRMEVVGQPRADIIPHLKQLKKQAVLADLAEDKAIVVFGTQPQRDPELRKRAAEDVFKMAKALPNIQLVLKLHPRETVPAYYHDIAAEVGCTNYLIPPQVDLYRLLAVCNVLITCFSTIGAEVVYFDKPLVILDHLVQDIQGYKAAGVAWQAVDADSLTSIISEILSGKREIDTNAYEQFQAHYAYQGNLPISTYILKKVQSH